jgi:hypothetical protein
MPSDPKQIVSIRMDPALLEWARGHSEGQGLTLSAWIGSLVERERMAHPSIAELRECLVKAIALHERAGDQERVGLFRRELERFDKRHPA